MTYDMPTNITSVSDYMVWIDGSTQNYFGIVMLIVVFTITLMISLNKFDVKMSSNAAFAGFLTTLCSLLFWAMGWLGANIMIICIVLEAIFIVWAYTERTQ